MQVTKQSVLIALIVVLCCSIACKKNHHHITRGFYYWKTVYDPSVYELDRLDKLQVKKMYIRLFDVDWDAQTNQFLPVAPVKLPPRLPAKFDFVPVVFITQKVLTNLQEKDIVPLAQRISGFIRALCRGSEIEPREIQIDCDWAAGTRDMYFRLLNELKRQDYFKGKKLSCTIRMHQVKYITSSGIPPVDKGLLMCYSMGDLKKPGPRNSILDVNEAKNYLKRISLYALPLDIALPLFQWCVLFREEKFTGILHDITPAEVATSKLFEHTEADLYRCRADTTLRGIELKRKDMIRTESVSYEDLQEIANFTAQQLIQPDINVLLFSCDSITLAKYSIHELESVYNTYR